MVIAIDGPAGAGKSTVARRLANELEFVFLNSGSFYRAVAFAAQQKQINLEDADALVALASSLKIEYENGCVFLDGRNVESEIHTEEIGMLTSKISAIPEVRHAVNKKMKAAVKGKSIVCEGRDMTTVVFPDAECKIYLDASLDVQARRRFEEYKSKGIAADLSEIREKIAERDAQDKNKKEGSLLRAEDAHYIDTSNLDIEQVCENIKKILNQRVNIMGESEKNVSRSALQEEFLKDIDEIQEGALVEGVVIEVSDEFVFLDVKCKSEARIPCAEFDVVPKIGDKVEVVLKNKENKHGDVVVSKQEADEARIWKGLKDAKVNQTPVGGTISKTIKGGFEVDLGGGITAFLPTSQADIQRVEVAESLLGTKGEFLLEHCERERGTRRTNIVVNRRKLLEQQLEERRDKFFAEKQIGDTVSGVVKSFTSFGAFVDLGGFDGLLHVNDMSWGHVTRPKDFVKKGQEIELKIVRLDPEGKRINLSLKHFTEDPWMHFEDNFGVNDIVHGKVTKLTEFGAFIELAEGIEGLAHISEFSWTKHLQKPEEMVKIGDEVDCMILGYDVRAGRVSLSLKQAAENPWDKIGEKYPVHTRVHGKVSKLTNTGAFIEFDDGISAFLHADDFSWTKKLKHFGGQLSVGQELDVVILECDVENSSLRVGVKQLSEDPWNKFAAEYPVGTKMDAEVVSVLDFGVFVRVVDGIEGLINKQNILSNKDESFETAVKRYNVGDKIEVYVADINADKQKIAFSVTEVQKKLHDDAKLSSYLATENDDGEGTTLGDMLKSKE